jgi:hypothetical protein
MKALLDFLDLVADLFFDVGSFVNLEADVNVHLSRLERGEKTREAAVLTKELYTRSRDVKVKFATGSPFLFHVDGILR